MSCTYVCVHIYLYIYTHTLSFQSHYKLYYIPSPFFEVSIAYEINTSWLQNIQACTRDVLCVIHLFVLHSQYFYIILHWQYHRIVSRNHHCSAVFWCLSYNQINRDCRAYCSTQHIHNQHDLNKEMILSAHQQFPLQQKWDWSEEFFPTVATVHTWRMFITRKCEVC